MKRFVRFVATAAIVLLFVTIAAADTLELRDGRVLMAAIWEVRKRCCVFKLRAIFKRLT